MELYDMVDTPEGPGRLRGITRTENGDEICHVEVVVSTGHYTDPHGVKMFSSSRKKTAIVKYPKIFCHKIEEPEEVVSN